MQTNVLIEQPVKLAGDVEDRDLQLLQKAVMEALQAAGAVSRIVSLRIRPLKRAARCRP